MIFPRIVAILAAMALFLPAWPMLTSAEILDQSVVDDQIVAIYTIQGDGNESPFQTQKVDTLGLVTAVTANGFFLQDPLGDGLESTSDGIFVYTRRSPGVAVGQCLRVLGAEVVEYYAKTELIAPDDLRVEQSCPKAALEPVPLPRAAVATDPEARFEALEGMLVHSDRMSGIVQGPTKRYRNGDVEIGLVDAQVMPYLAGGRVFQADASATPALIYLSNLLGYELPSVDWGDQLTLHAVAGILDYNFGKYQLLPFSGSIMGKSDPLSAEREPPSVNAGSDFSVCAVNLWGMGRGTSQHPQPSDYAHHLRSRARLIDQSLGGCMVIGLQEAGNPEDVEALAAQLVQEHGLSYDATAMAGPGTWSQSFPLTNGLLTRSDRVRVVAVEARQGCSAKDYGVQDLYSDCPAGAFALFNRPPLVADLEVEGEWGEPFELTVIVNHWKSKGGDEDVNVVRRGRQATHVAALVQERLSESPAANVIVLGDLNDYYTSGPVETLRTQPEPDLVHVYDFLPDLERYTYIFNGASQVLDHILVTENLRPAVAEVMIARVNVDYAVADEAETVIDEHVSDHDPVYLRIRPGGAASLGADLDFGGVALRLLDDQGEIIARAVTDAGGEFRMWDLPPGEYVLSADSPSHILPAHAEAPLSLSAGYQDGVGLDFRHSSVEAAVALALATGNLVFERVSDRSGD